MRIGANFNNGKCEFIVWSPFSRSMFLEVSGNKELLKMKKDNDDYWKINVDVNPDDKYSFIINGDNRKPDPASNYQPEGVHGASQIIDHNSFDWEDEKWKGIPLKEMIMYELHIGTFTNEGTFLSAIEKLDYLKEIGVNMIEVMPVAQFPGNRNWGYDGVYAFAVQNSYGSCDDFKQFINECHKNNLGVILDVVYNHLGPEGNYTTQYGPYFTSKYHTVWGDAINFDDEYSGHVRNFFFENALYWLNNFHIDALRLDAIDSIYDLSGKHFLQELKEKVDEFTKYDARERFLIAESDLNDVKIINPVEKGGYNLDAQWSDDFHHSVHSFLTGENDGYYGDYGSINHIKKALTDTFVYSGNYSEFRKRKHGNSAEGVEPYKFVVCIQNHDQVGNRPFGKRLTHLAEFEKLKLAAGLMILSPYTPLLFMGEEFAAETPFLYFIDHIDEKLVEAVGVGRREEFKSFMWQKDIPEPGDDETFLRSKINWESINEERNNAIFNFYKKLIELRKNIALLQNRKRSHFHIKSTKNDNTFIMSTQDSSGEIYVFFNFDDEEIQIDFKFPEGNWKKLIDSSSEQWLGPGEISHDIISGESNLTLNRFSFILYERNDE